jgi:HPt (histidine-containing phosphotransfer) domain-containing protein
MLDLMWHKYLPDIRQRAQVLEDAARSASAGNLSQSEREAAKSAAHKLAGTLGTFGLSRGTDLARELEHIYADVTPASSAAHLTAIAEEINSIIESRK